MNSGSSVFSAAPSAAGYLYQARLALALSIAHVYKGVGVEVAIERLDDISFERNGTAFELLQTKHHISRTASLTDLSPDIWKTLRVWIDVLNNDLTLPSHTRLMLVTSGRAPDGSAASFLRPDSAYPPGTKRNPKTAEALLTKAAEASSNDALAPAFRAYLSLTPPMRASLLSAIDIIDNQPVLDELDEVIEDSLRLAASRGKAKVVREMLEGWWWPRVCRALVDSPAGKIPVAEMEAKIDDIREALKRDALPVEFDEVPLSEADSRLYDGFRFVQQLTAVGAAPRQMGHAKRDYYRAFAQRSKWTREHVVLDGELARFEAQLIEEWEPRFGAMCDVHALETVDNETLQNAGKEILAWVEQEARFPLRTLNHRFLCVGSYHMLANDLRVGWHRDFHKLCSEGQ